MKIQELVVDAILKKCFGCDTKNFKTVIEIPNQDNPSNPPIKVTISAESLKIQIEKER